MRIVIGLLFSLSVLPSFLKTCLLSTYFNALGKVKLDNKLLKLWCMKKVNHPLEMLSFDLTFQVLLMLDLRMYIQNENLDYYF